MPGPEEPGPVHLGGVEEVAGYRGEPGQDDDAGKGKAAPDVDDQDGQPGPEGIAKPIWVGLVQQVQLMAEQVVDDAELGVEHPLPAQQ